MHKRKYFKIYIIKVWKIAVQNFPTTVPIWAKYIKKNMILDYRFRFNIILLSLKQQWDQTNLDHTAQDVLKTGNKKYLLINIWQLFTIKYRLP